MNTEPSLTQQPIPRHVIAGITCGVLALVLTLAAIAYYWLIGTNTLPEPPRGLSPIWAMIIVLPAMVPIGLWCAHVAARPLHQRLERQERQFEALQAEVRSAVDRFTGEALEQARNAGKWEGFATGIRDTADSADIRPFQPRRSG